MLRRQNANTAACPLATSAKGSAEGGDKRDERGSQSDQHQQFLDARTGRPLAELVMGADAIIDLAADPEWSD